jgi:AcrR family transcriptional regulator
LLEQAYAYALSNGLADLSLRPLSAAIGSSPRVLLYLFGSKDGLIRALLARARQDQLGMLEDLRRRYPEVDLSSATLEVWGWLSHPRHRNLLKVWMEGYARSLMEPDGPWSAFGRTTVEDWLDVLALYQPSSRRSTAAGLAERTAALSLLRGALLDLLATGDRRRTTAALRAGLASLTVRH